MRKFFLPGTLAFFLFLSGQLQAQDFSNKGKDFWVGYGYHERMSGGGGGSQNMVLYFATEAPTRVTVSMPGTGYTQTYSIPANTIFTSNPIPKAGANDARLDREGVSNRGIHITSDNPIVAYAHIYNQSVSGATLLFPTSTLGKDYYSINYNQESNSANANCWFYAVAVEPGITTVEITPSGNTIDHVGGTPFTVDLQQGEVINIMGRLTGQSGDIFRGVDLTGSRIRTISTGTEGCKRIAVFSGSGRISLVCDGIGSGQKSSDNYMVQAFPKNAWGKNYLTVPTQLLENNVYRIAVDDPATVVRFNGTVLTGLINNFYYEVGPIRNPSRIESDKPVMVAQYISTSRFCGNTASGDLGDPEVIYLSPIEQTINKVILNSTPNFSISRHFINVTIPNGGTAISSFRLDGNAPTASFITHPQNPAYSFASIEVGAGQHVLLSDSGFNAIAYGYGDFESYGYNAGANVKDLYQFVTIGNQYSNSASSAACKDDPFTLAMTFPYLPLEISWKFNGLFPDVTIPNPVPDATSVVNGRTLYRFNLPGNFTTTSGTYPIKITALNTTSDGCNGLQEIDYELRVYDPPTADFDFTGTGCIGSPIGFTGTAANTTGSPIVQWYWNFADGNTAAASANTTHSFTAAGNYNVQYSVISEAGCTSDTAVKSVLITPPPIANFTIGSTACAGKTVSFADISTVVPGGTISKRTWDFGDGSPIRTVLDNNLAQTHSYSTTGTYTITLQVETSTGCPSTVFSRTITVHPNPVVDFNVPIVCLPAGTANFTNSSTISDGTSNLFAYSWNFGDGSPNAAGPAPVHQYASVGPFNVELSVTSNNGCTNSLIKPINSIYPEPQSAFNAPSEVCLGTAINFQDQSSVTAGSISQWEWNFGDATGSTDRNPVKTYTNPGTYTVTLTAVSNNGCRSVAKIAQRTIVVNALPVAGFTAVLPGCSGQAVRFNETAVANAGAITKWNWNFGDAGMLSATNNNPVFHIYPVSNTYAISLQVETDKGCISTVFEQLLQIHPTPVADFSVPEICVNDINAPFTDASIVTPGTIAAWEWNFGDANALPGNPNTSTIQNATHHFTRPGNYMTRLVAESAAGCRDTIQRTVVVNGAVLTPRFNVATPGTLCSNKTVSITDASQLDAGNITRVEIFWDENNPADQTIDLSPVIGKTYTHDYPSFGSPASRTYRIRYDIYSGISCVNSYAETITLLAAPILANDAELPICTNAPAFQLNGSLQNIIPGAGSYFGAGTTTSGIFDPSIAGAGAHPVVYTFTGSNGCSSSITKTIQVNPTPQADAGPDKFVLEGGSIELTPVRVRDIPVSYSWSPVTGLSDPGIANPVVIPAADTRYTLTVTSDRGCTSSDDVLVKLLLTPIIPNIFSPNGDGIHDRWVIDYLESYPGCVVQIYNRYGQLVHRVVNYTTPWDGKIKGADAPIGTYYYIIDPKNGRKPFTGFVDIIR